VQQNVKIPLRSTGPIDVYDEPVYGYNKDFKSELDVGKVGRQLIQDRLKLQKFVHQVQSITDGNDTAAQYLRTMNYPH